MTAGCRLPHRKVLSMPGICSSFSDTVSKVKQGVAEVPDEIPSENLARIEML